MTISEYKPAIIDPFDTQCTLCTILIGGTTTCLRHETGQFDTQPRKEQKSYQWQGHTVCRTCALRIAKIDKTYHDAMTDEMRYNIGHNMYRKAKVAQLTIQLGG
jgi:hypothetical protein